MRKSLENSIIDAVLAEDLPNAAHQLTQSSPLDVVSIMGRVGAHHAAVIFAYWRKIEQLKFLNSSNQEFKEISFALLGARTW